MIRSWYRIFFLSLVVFQVATWCLVSHAGKKAVGVRLPDGDVLPAFCFFPGEHVANPWPGVVVAANAGGAKLTQYHTYCHRLSDKGFAVLLIDASGYPEWLTPGADTWRKMPYHIWAWINHLSVVTRMAMGCDWYLRNIDCAVDFLRNHPRVNPSQIAVSGFSQSANVALSYASGCRKIACLVWNNGGWPWTLPYDPSKLPPVLLFHGDADGVYNVRYARKLSSELQSAHSEFECHIYPGQRHMFNLYYDLENPGDDDNPAIKSSFRQLVVFLNRVLKRQAPGVRRSVRDGATAPTGEPGYSGLTGLRK
jgi:dienelactone hydrolase